MQSWGRILLLKLEGEGNGEGEREETEGDQVPCHHELAISESCHTEGAIMKRIRQHSGIEIWEWGGQKEGQAQVSWWPLSLRMHIYIELQSRPGRDLFFSEFFIVVLEFLNYSPCNGCFR